MTTTKKLTESQVEELNNLLTKAENDDFLSYEIFEYLWLEKGYYKKLKDLSAWIKIDVKYKRLVEKYRRVA